MLRTGAEPHTVLVIEVFGAVEMRASYGRHTFWGRLQQRIHRAADREQEAKTLSAVITKRNVSGP